MWRWLFFRAIFCYTTFLIYSYLIYWSLLTRSVKLISAMYRPLRATSLGFGSGSSSGISAPFLCMQLLEMPPAGSEGGCHPGGGMVLNLPKKKRRQDTSHLVKNLKWLKTQNSNQPEYGPINPLTARSLPLNWFYGAWANHLAQFWIQCALHLSTEPLTHLEVGSTQASMWEWFHLITIPLWSGTGWEGDNRSVPLA